jgi:hypothetical protein
MKDKQAIALYKIYQHQIQHLEWWALNPEQIITSRQTQFEIISKPSFRLGNHIVSNRLY